MSVAVALRDYILADPVISGLLDGWKVFSSQPPQGATLPMIVYTCISTDASDGLDGTVLADGSRFQFDCYAATRRDSDLLWTILRNRLAGTREVVSDEYLRITQAGGFAHLIDRAEVGSDQQRYITTEDFLVFHGN